jgi:hypothetical protein
MRRRQWRVELDDSEGGGGGKNDLRGAEVEVEVEVEGIGCSSGPKSSAGAIPARARKDVNRCTSDSRSVRKRIYFDQCHSSAVTKAQNLGAA